MGAEKKLYLYTARKKKKFNSNTFYITLLYVLCRKKREKNGKNRNNLLFEALISMTVARSCWYTCVCIPFFYSPALETKRITRIKRRERKGKNYPAYIFADIKKVKVTTIIHIHTRNVIFVPLFQLKFYLFFSNVLFFDNILYKKKIFTFFFFLITDRCAIRFEMKQFFLPPLVKVAEEKFLLPLNYFCLLEIHRQD